MPVPGTGASGQSHSAPLTGAPVTMWTMRVTDTRFHRPYDVCMRIAFAANPALGHVLPLLPLALAARDAGHDVAVIGGASVAGAVSRVGLRHVVAGPPDLPSVFASVPERAGLTGRRLAAVTWGKGFAGILAPALASATLELARDWRRLSAPYWHSTQSC